MDFACTPHTDRNDRCDGFTDNFIARLGLLLNCEHVIGSLKDEVLNAISFLKYWGAGVPTTCCYQYIGDCNMEDEEIEVYHFFVCKVWICAEGYITCGLIHSWLIALCTVHQFLYIYGKERHTLAFVQDIQC